jgi:hypothetical protein
MRLAIPVALFLCIVVGFSSGASAQNLSSEVVEAGKRVDEAFDYNLKGWTRERIVPIQGSSNVIVENWRTYDRSAKISIGIRSPEAEDVARNNPTFQKIEGIGDEAFIWGYFGHISFRHGRFGVSVSSEVDLNLLSQNKDENRATSRTESAATSRLLACFINLALDGKLAKTRLSKEPIFQRPCEQELVFKRLIGDDLLRQLTNRY